MKRRLPIYGECDVDAAVRCVIDQPGYNDRLYRIGLGELADFVDNHVGIDAINEFDRWFAGLDECPCCDDDVQAMREDHESGRRRALRFFVSRHLRRVVAEKEIGHDCTIRPMAAIQVPSTGGVYAIEGAGGYVKIGKAKNIQKRIRDIQVAHPVPLKLLAVLSTDPADEGRFHKQWSRLRRSGEWFEPDAEFRSFIAQARVAA